MTRKIGEDNKDKEHEGRSSKYILDGDSATKHTEAESHTHTFKHTYIDTHIHTHLTNLALGNNYTKTKLITLIWHLLP